MKTRRTWFGYETVDAPVASVTTFRRRLLQSGLLAGGIVIFSLGIGMLGYRWIVGVEDWYDCFLSAAMILGGMGPVGRDPSTPAGKVFAGLYALYCGVVLLVSVGLLLTPVAHRLMHRFHVAVDDTDDDRNR